ncbi:hypothetical protein WSK_3266 [Novosphingobium sp. Rr 2-17]|nr:benenodin family lasso peptide [Novosphingobium sp. Rr 2-17]EIZ78128.1 hypothetical protein WSK_3266 [Novosphingobium sp. Rr 2-17]
MDRLHDIIDLGAASVETKGPIGEGSDLVLGQNPAGLSDD